MKERRKECKFVVVSHEIQRLYFLLFSTILRELSERKTFDTHRSYYCCFWASKFRPYQYTKLELHLFFFHLFLRLNLGQIFTTVFLLTKCINFDINQTVGLIFTFDGNLSIDFMRGQLSMSQLIWWHNSTKF